MELLDLFCDAQSIKNADNRHVKLFLHQKSSLVSKKKRQAEDSLAADKTKVSRTSTDAASSGHLVVGAYPNAENQWTSGYAQRAPWPQNSQEQGQQWNPGYAPQVAYNAYGNANYGAPQIPMPTSAPQTAAAYGSCPSAYPAQECFVLFLCMIVCWFGKKKKRYWKMVSHLFPRPNPSLSTACCFDALTTLVTSFSDVYCHREPVECRVADVGDKMM